MALLPHGRPAGRLAWSQSAASPTQLRFVRITRFVVQAESAFASWVGAQFVRTALFMIQAESAFASWVGLDISPHMLAVLEEGQARRRERRRVIRERWAQRGGPPTSCAAAAADDATAAAGCAVGIQVFARFEASHQ